jgi:hypothetical protein
MTLHSASIQSRSTLILLALVFAVPALAIPALAETEEPASPQTDVSAPAPAAASAPRLAIYRPPSVGKPTRTVGGGSRGPGDGVPELYVLVPQHVGRTVSEQPSLFWYVDDVPATPIRVDFTLLDEDGIDPLVHVTLEPITRAGTHRVQLSDYDVKLEAGREYEWSISLIPDLSARGKDIVSTGWIDRVTAPSGMDEALSSGGEEARVFIFAENGLWYDALAALEQRSEGDRGEMRAALLRQVGLESVASSGL